MNNEILQAKDELIAVKAEMNGVDIDSPEFNADNWDSLKKSKARLTAKIEQLEAHRNAVTVRLNYLNSGLKNSTNL